ncbi:MAG: glutathione S-transferase family protein [Nevskia sp.]
MTLLYSSASPYARKVRVLAHELGLAAAIELVSAPVSPVELNATVVERNPLAKVPTLVLADGTQLYDSRVISEYLLSLKPGSALLPAGGSERWAVLRRQALCDGILDASLLVRYEEWLRPAARRWPAWQDGQEAKIHRGLAQLEAEADALGGAARLDTIAAACVCGYLDLRFARLAWRAQAPKLAAFEAVFAERPSMVATRP